jgi:hypothetical protein
MYLCIENDHLLILSSILDQRDLVQIASDMVPYSEMNTIKISLIPTGRNTVPLNNVNVIGIDQLYLAALIDQNAFLINGFAGSK